MFQMLQVMTQAAKEVSLFLIKRVKSENVKYCCIDDCEIYLNRNYESVLPFWFYYQNTTNSVDLLIWQGDASRNW